LHNDELYSLYSSLHIVKVIKSRKIKWAGLVHAWKREEIFTGFWLGEPKGRPRQRWDNNIKMNLREICIDEANWLWLTQNRIQWRGFVSKEMTLGF
jgi:hypothetical protein